jgi:hypothetical protein
MAPLLLLAASVVAASPDDWKFVDESTRDGRSVMTFRTVELADAPSRPLHPDDRPPAGSRFGSVALGPGGRHRLGVVWHADSGSLWFDADGDGRYAAAERYVLSPKPLEVAVAVPFGDGSKQTRTVLIRRRAEGLAWAVRGYTVGTVTLRGKAVAAMLTDGDADGCFAAVAADRIWLDLDGDGTFDPLTEQFPLGTAIPVGGTALLIQPRADGLGVRVRERPHETGALVVRVGRSARVVELATQYVSEFGELAVVREAGRPVAVPVGRYRLQALRLRLEGGDDQVWLYTFASGGSGYDVVVDRGREAIHEPLAGLKLSVTHEAAAAAAPGESVVTVPEVTAGDLYLTKCEVGTLFAPSGREVTATIELSGSGGTTLDRAFSGFSSGVPFCFLIPGTSSVIALAMFP